MKKKTLIVFGVCLLVATGMVYGESNHHNPQQTTNVGGDEILVDVEGGNVEVQQILEGSRSRTTAVYNPPPGLPMTFDYDRGSGYNLATGMGLSQRRWDFGKDDRKRLGDAFPTGIPFGRFFAGLGNGGDDFFHRGCGFSVTNTIEKSSRPRFGDGSYSPLDVFELDLGHDVLFLRRLREELRKRDYVSVGKVEVQGFTGKKNASEHQVSMVCVREAKPYDVDVGIYIPKNGDDRNASSVFLPGISVATSHDKVGGAFQAGIVGGQSRTSSRPDGTLICFRKDPEEMRRRKIGSDLLSIWGALVDTQPGGESRASPSAEVTKDAIGKGAISSAGANVFHEKPDLHGEMMEN
jgi:hypothetical protein